MNVSALSAGGSSRHFQSSWWTSTTPLPRLVPDARFILNNSNFKSNTHQALHACTAIAPILQIVLSLGNYLNGGTARGQVAAQAHITNHPYSQADGFALDILAKLADIKTQDGTSHALAFVARTYASRSADETLCPVPDPQLFKLASQAHCLSIDGS